MREENVVPIVNVRVTPGISKKQSAAIVEEITDTLVRILKKKPEYTHVVIDEVAEDKWGFAGKLAIDSGDHK